MHQQHKCCCIVRFDKADFYCGCSEKAENDKSIFAGHPSGRHDRSCFSDLPGGSKTG